MKNTIALLLCSILAYGQAPSAATETEKIKKRAHEYAYLDVEVKLKAGAKLRGRLNAGPTELTLESDTTHVTVKYDDIESIHRTGQLDDFLTGVAWIVMPLIFIAFSPIILLVLGIQDLACHADPACNNS